MIKSTRQWDEDCPYFGQEHGRHFYRVDDPEGFGSWNRSWKSCLGWHEMEARDFTYCRTRFHAPYIRGNGSNLIHRSTHEGTIVWCPDEFFSYSPSHIISWTVKTMCSLPALKNPILIADAKAMREQKLVETPTALKYFSEIHLCGRCFPINQERTSHPLAK